MVLWLLVILSFSSSSSSLKTRSDYPEFFDIGEGYTEDVYMETLYWADDPDEEWQFYAQAWTAESGFAPAMGTWASPDEVEFFKLAIEATGVTGDPAKLEEKRRILAEWSFNVEQFPFISAPADIVNDIAYQPVHGNQIKNNTKVHIEVIPTGRKVPALHLDKVNAARAVFGLPPVTE